MQSYEQSIQERLGAALQALTFLEQRAAGGPDARRMQSLLKQCRQLVSDLEHGFMLLQQATTQQSAMRHEVEAASTRAGLMFDLSPVPCVVVDDSGSIVEANSAATRLLNTSLRYLQAKSFDLFLGADRQSFNMWLRGLSQAGDSDRRPVQLRPREQRAKAVTLVGTREGPGRIALVITDRVAAGEAFEADVLTAGAGA